MLSAENFTQLAKLIMVCTGLGSETSLFGTISQEMLSCFLGKIRKNIVKYCQLILMAFSG